MKTFIALTTIAFLSAGIYGFIDMAHDVHNGTMIDYRNNKSAEKEMSASEKKDAAITAKLKAANKEIVKKDRQTIYSAYANVKGKTKKKEEAAKEDYLGEYSRGGFERRYMESMAIDSLKTDSSANQ